MPSCINEGAVLDLLTQGHQCTIAPKALVVLSSVGATVRLQRYIWLNSRCVILCLGYTRKMKTIQFDRCFLGNRSATGSVYFYMIVGWKEGKEWPFTV